MITYYLKKAIEEIKQHTICTLVGENEIRKYKENDELNQQLVYVSTNGDGNDFLVHKDDWCTCIKIKIEE